MLALAAHTHLAGLTRRAAGTAALLRSSASVGVGLVMGGRLVARRGPDMRVTHEALSLATMVALVVHAVVLLGDSYLHPSVADIALPFASSFARLWMTAGIYAGWAMIILGLSYYARTRIGMQRWRRLHRLTAVAWLLGIAHALGQGTDAGQAWFLAATGLAVLPAFALLVIRHAGLRPRRAERKTLAVPA
jgi:sulfoxide reductase heme-binding subunit YedZ